MLDKRERSWQKPPRVRLKATLTHNFKKWRTAGILPGGASNAFIWDAAKVNFLKMAGIAMSAYPLKVPVSICWGRSTEQIRKQQHGNSIQKPILNNLRKPAVNVTGAVLHGTLGAKPFALGGLKKSQL